ncbi:MAG: FAD/NAD(P)-binding protein [Balneolaceae bacterium]|nr:FAD/NAD(P)-binding protein [Balneolaceae bacterium]
MGVQKTIRKVAIIGGGPKGIYAFERLAAWFKVKPPSERTEIHIFNRSDSFGAGENYSIGQPAWLLINNPVGDVNMWAEEMPPPVIPHPLSLTEWVCRNENLYVTDYDYISRAMVGRYLVNGFTLIASNLPEKVVGKYIVGEVTDIYIDSGKYTLCMKSGGDEKKHLTDLYDHVLLATGHPKNRATEDQLRYQSFAGEPQSAGYIPFVYPAEKVFKDLPPGCSVGIKGIGLTFVDAVLALTEGKGGLFLRNEKTGKIVYTPSGNEPKVIYPFSRSGLPMLPRRSVPGKKISLKFFTKSAIQMMQNEGKIDFKQQLWPLLKQEMIYAYYDTVMKEAELPEGLAGSVDIEDIQRAVAKYHKKYPAMRRFDPETFLEPLQKKDSFNDQTFHQYVQSQYNFYLKEARKGELKSPLAAVTAVWRKASPLFCEIYSFGGLTPESQRHFDHSFRGKLNRVTFGPPVESAEKIAVLMESGVLNFETARNPKLSLDEKTGSFILESGHNSNRNSVQYLVDARIPRMSLTNDRSSLFRNLLDRELITIFENRSGQETYKTGAVNITPGGFVIDREGNVNPGIAVTGTPTEGITFDNDTLSRNRNNFVDSWAEYISKEYAKSEIEHYAN